MSETALATVPRTTIALNEVKAMADAAARSGLFPSLRTPEAAFTLMMLCQAEGLHPIQALRRFDIVQGRPALKSDAMLGEFQQRGGTVEWLQHDAEACRAVFAAPGLAKPVTVTWTMEDAKRAGLAGKSGPWQQYPRQMLRARVISEGIRMAMPAVVVGLYAPEEVQDFVRPAQVVEAIVEPPKAPANDATSAPVPMTGESASPPSEVLPAMITPGQVKRLMAAVTKLYPGNHKDPIVHAARIEWLKWAVEDEALTSSKELTEEQATLAIKRAEAGEVMDQPGASDD